MLQSTIKPNDKQIYIKTIPLHFFSSFHTRDKQSEAAFTALYKRFCSQRVSFRILIEIAVPLPLFVGLWLFGYSKKSKQEKTKMLSVVLYE